MNFLKYLLLLTICTQAHSAPIFYDESSDGDLYNFYHQSGSIDLTLDVGTNILIGNISGDNQSRILDFDSFVVSVPNGLVLISVNSYFSPDNTTSFGSTGWAIHAEPPPNGYLGSVSISSFGIGLDREYITSTDIALPLGDGIYQFYNGGVGYNGVRVGDHATYSMDYRFEFVVIPVPLPGSLMLFISALLPIFALGRLTNHSCGTRSLRLLAPQLNR